MIFLINYFSEKINDYKRRNRNKKSYYKYFLVWISLVILITAIFYCINYNLYEKNSEVYPIIREEISYPAQLSENYDIKMPPATVRQNNIMEIPKTNVSRNLYDEVLRTVNKIPPPLNFVDDVKFEI